MNHMATLSVTWDMGDRPTPFPYSSVPLVLLVKGTPDEIEVMCERLATHVPLLEYAHEDRADRPNTWLSLFPPSRASVGCLASCGDLTYDDTRIITWLQGGPVVDAIEQEMQDDFEANYAVGENAGDVSALNIPLEQIDDPQTHEALVTHILTIHERRERAQE